MAKKVKRSPSKAKSKKATSKSLSALDQVYKVQSAILNRPAQDGQKDALELVDTRNGEFYQITGIASKVFKKLDGKKPLKAVIAQVAGVGSESQKRSGEATRFIRDLMAADLVFKVKPRK